jgi:hypothetical protein
LDLLSDDDDDDEIPSNEDLLALLQHIAGGILDSPRDGLLIKIFQLLFNDTVRLTLQPSAPMCVRGESFCGRIDSSEPISQILPSLRIEKVPLILNSNWMKPHRMMSCRAYINNDRQTQHTLLCLKVNERVVYSSDEDESGHSANPVLDVAWEDDKTELLIRAKIATITLGSCSFSTATSEVPACAYGIPILLKEGVFFAMRQSSHTNVVEQLERLHFATLQKFCLRGPDSPFDKLRVARNEWYDAHASGTGCRAVMINRIKRLHLAREIEKSVALLQLDKANTRSFFFVAALVDKLEVNSIALGVVDQEAKDFALSGSNSGKKYACGVFHIPWCSSSPFRVTYELGNIRYTIDVPALCEPFALGNDGAIIFFAGHELPPVSSWLQNLDHAEYRQKVTHMASTIANETYCYALDVTSLPKLGAVVVVPLSLATRSVVACVTLTLTLTMSTGRCCKTVAPWRQMCERLDLLRVASGTRPLSTTGGKSK